MLITLTKKPAAGFTILELAIVLLIVSALTASLLGPFTNYLYQRQVALTEKSLDEIKEALLGFAAAHGRLPRPAGNGGDGTEDPAINCNDNYCSGLIPWQTLGIARMDAWNNFIRYSVAGTFSDSNAPIKFTSQSTLDVDTRLPGAAAMTKIATNIPAIVWSIGRRDVLDGVNSDEQDNRRLFLHTSLNSADPNIITRQYSEAGAVGGEFDDLVVWVSAPVLFNRMLSGGQSLR